MTTRTFLPFFAALIRAEIMRDWLAKRYSVMLIRVTDMSIAASRKKRTRIKKLW